MLPTVRVKTKVKLLTNNKNVLGVGYCESIVYGVYEMLFVVEVICWVILRFVFDSFFFLPHSFITFLFVRRICKGIKDGRKKARIPLDSNFKRESRICQLQKQDDRCPRCRVSS